MKGDPVTTAIPWFRPEQWELLFRVADDRQEFAPSYRDWLIAAERQILELALTGVQVQRVELDVDDLISWCHRRGLPNTKATRSQYVAEVGKKALSVKDPGSARDTDSQP